jgi:MFS family permease
MYYFSGYLADVYFDSFVYITMRYSAKDYTYFTNILTVGLCFFAFIAGLGQRYFHRYKYQQLAGLSIRIIAFGVQYAAVKNPSTALLVTARVLVGLGGGMVVIASQVAAQASVPHQDLAIAIAVLALWTQLGGAVASAISASVWTAQVPAKLTEHLGDYYNATGRAEIFSSLLVAQLAEPHDLVVKAYSEAFAPLNLAGLCTAVLALIAGFFASNYHLGDEHNAIEENKKIRFRSQEETSEEAIKERVRAVQEKIEADLAAERQQRF